MSAIAAKTNDGGRENGCVRGGVKRKKKKSKGKARLLLGRTPPSPPASMRQTAREPLLYCKQLIDPTEAGTITMGTVQEAKKRQGGEVREDQGRVGAQCTMGVFTLTHKGT